MRYIHLNPLRAGLVPDLASLGRYPWSGHADIMGKATLPGQAVAEVLQHFGSRPAAARKSYLRIIEDGIAFGRQPELVGCAPGLAVDAADESHQKIVDRRVLDGDDFRERLQQQDANAPGITKAIPLPALLLISRAARRRAEILMERRAMREELERNLKVTR